MNDSISWSLIPGSVNYLSGCGNFIATREYSLNGHGVYMVHSSHLSPHRRTSSNALAIGGLPRFLFKML